MKKLFQVIAIASIVGVSSAATAQTLSSGCTLMNDAALDALAAGASPSGLEFFANEIISISASSPTGAGNATNISLSIDGTEVDSAGFPGSLSYQFLSDAPSVDVDYGAFDATILVGPNSAEVTWSVSCSVFVAPQQVPAMPWYMLLFLATGLAYVGHRKVQKKARA